LCEPPCWKNWGGMRGTIAFPENIEVHPANSPVKRDIPQCFNVESLMLAWFPNAHFSLNNIIYWHGYQVVPQFGIAQNALRLGYNLWFMIWYVYDCLRFFCLSKSHHENRESDNRRWIFSAQSGSKPLVLQQIGQSRVMNPRTVLSFTCV